MELCIHRNPAVDDAVLGRLDLSGIFECFTLERLAALIPSGRYPIKITFSYRFGRMLPLVDNVPRRTGIRIHPGNTTHDTEGCILVGNTKTNNEVLGSRAAMEALQSKIALCLANGSDVWLTIENGASGGEGLRA